MKLRTGFVSNSSSASYVFAARGNLYDVVLAATGNKKGARDVANTSYKEDTYIKDLYLSLEESRRKGNEAYVEEDRKDIETVESLLKEGFEIFIYIWDWESNDCGSELGFDTLGEALKKSRDLVVLGEDF